MKSRTLFFHCVLSALAGFPPTTGRANVAPLVFDRIDSHYWIGETWGADVTAENVVFQGRRCLRSTVTQTTPEWALFRTDRFKLDNLKHGGATRLRADVYFATTGTTGLKVEFRGASFDPVKVALKYPNQPANTWLTLTYPLDLLSNPCGSLSFVIDDLAGRAPVFYMDNLRLTDNAGTTIRQWDTMDAEHLWSAKYFCDPRGGSLFPGYDPVDSQEGRPGGDGISLCLPWCSQTEDRAEVATSGRLNEPMQLDLTAYNQVSFWAKTTDTARPVGIFFGGIVDNKFSGFSPPAVFLPASNEWHQVTLDIPWPASFPRHAVTAVSLFVDKLNGAPDGSVRFDEIVFSCVPLHAAEVGTAAVVEDFNQLNAGLNRLGAGASVFADVDGLAGDSFVPPNGSDFARRVDVKAGAEFGGYYSGLHGRSDYPEFTMDATRFEYVRFKVKSGTGQPFTAALKVEAKGAGATDIERCEHTAFRILQIPLTADSFTTVTLPLNVADRTAWTHNKFAPNKAALKEIVILAEKHFNALPLSFVVDDIELVDTDGPEPPAATASNSVLLPHLLHENLTYFLRERHPATGLVLDRESFSDLAGVAATGFGLSAWPIAAVEGLISRNTAYEYAALALTTLERPDKMSWTRNGPPPVSGFTGVDGFFYRYFDSRDGLRKIPQAPALPADASPADTAILVWGALSCKGAMTTANGYTPAQQQEIGRLVDSITDRVEWSRWIVEQDGFRRMILGFKPEAAEGYQRPFLGGYSSGGGGRFAAWDYHTDEILLIAMAGLSAADPAKALPPSFLKSWIRYRASYGGHSAVQSFFGSAFAHQFAGLWLPLHTFAPDPTGLDIYENNREALMANLAFSRSSFWQGRQDSLDGTSAFLTAHEGIDGRYAGHGAPPCGLCYFCRGTDLQYHQCSLIPRFEDFPHNTRPAPDMVNGSLSPYGAGAAFYYLPAEAATVLRHYYEMGLWSHGRGFPDAFHLNTAQFLAQETEFNAAATSAERLATWQRLNRISGRSVQHIQFGIDQGPLVISLANHLRSGLVQNWVMQNPSVVAARTAAFPAGVSLDVFASGLRYQQCGSELLLSWPQFAPGRTYTVERSTNLVQWSPVAVGLTLRWASVDLLPASPVLYYRVKSQP